MTKFRIYQDQATLWRWRLVARNGRVIADSGEGYSTRRAAELAVVRLCDGFVDINYPPVEYA